MKHWCCAVCTLEGDPGDLVARNSCCFPPGEADELDPDVHDLHLLHGLAGPRVGKSGWKTQNKISHGEKNRKNLCDWVTTWGLIYTADHLSVSVMNLVTRSLAWHSTTGSRGGEDHGGAAAATWSQWRKVQATWTAGRKIGASKFLTQRHEREQTLLAICDAFESQNQWLKTDGEQHLQHRRSC